MLRQFVCALAVLALFIGGAVAAEVKGKVKSVDAEKKTITITVDDKDMTYKCSDDCKVCTIKNKEKTAVDDGLKAKQFAKAGANVTLTIEGEGEKAVCKEIVIGGGKK
jgi:hypothetical protein